MSSPSCRVQTALFLLSAVSLSAIAVAQDRFKTMPGYDNYIKMRGKAAGLIKKGSVTATWAEDSKSFTFSFNGKSYKYDVATNASTETGLAVNQTELVEEEAVASGPRPGQARGRQVASAASPDAKWTANYHDRNLFVAPAGTKDEVAITTDGNEKARTKSGIGSWVYGEELFQSSAFWWSPDSKKIAYYRFDESNVIDYPLQVKQLALQSDTYTEPYPKAGKPNPIVDVFVYDVATKKSTRMDIRDGKPFTNDSVGHYVYGISWTPDSSELLMHRTNRKQNSMEYVAANPNTGTLRLIFREDWPASWTENSPQIRWLKDGKRFILRSERNGFHNFYLYDVSGKLIATITNLQAEVATIVRLEEDKNVMYYMARDGDNHMKMQLHRVGLDGKGEVRMTDPAFNHTVSLSPDGSEFVDVIQTHNSPPATRVVKADGTVLLKIATSDITAFTDQGYQPAEVFPYKSIDGIETCWGTISYPSHFDPKKKYPLLVLVYGGPATSSVSETFAAPSSTCDLGFIVAAFDGRNSSGRGKRLLDQLYLHLGGPEIDDQAAGVMVLRERPYVDGNRIGIYGTSYGGFASAMCLLRYPDVFTAASASSAVTAWNHYDSIYTERYMWLPEENADGYKFGSAMTYAKDKKGRLLIYYGTADDNVHPNNSMQLISALQRAGKSFEVQVGPDQGHSGVNFDRMMEFFYDAFGIR